MNDLQKLMNEVTEHTSQIDRLKAPKQVDYLLLDGSGSMSSRWLESMDALDKYALGLKAAGVETQMLMATFSGGRGLDYQVTRETTPQSWHSLALETPVCPGGDTPLYDAINVMVRSLRDLNPDKASIVIVTDGEENGSRTTNADQARVLLDWCRSRGWQVTFIGCDFNNLQMAKLMGGDSKSAIGAPTRRLVDVTAELAKKRAFHDKFGTPMHFTDDEKKRFGGFLSDQTNGS